MRLGNVNTILVLYKFTVCTVIVLRETWCNDRGILCNLLFPRKKAKMAFKAGPGKAGTHISFTPRSMTKVPPLRIEGTDNSSLII